MKYLVVIGDGMADNSVTELGGATPLEGAEKPVIDNLAAQGTLGNVRNVPDGFTPGSDVAIMSILGCDPRSCYSGRAPLEAAASGIKLAEGDAAMRCNIIAVSDTGDFPDREILSHSAGSIGGSEAKELAEYLFGHPDFKDRALNAGLELFADTSYRHLVVQRGVDSDNTVMNPPHDHLFEKVSSNLPRGGKNADILIDLMVRANAILDHHPINEARRRDGLLPGNSIWFWAIGTAAALPGFYERYGKTGALISAVSLCRGIAQLIGLDVIYVPGATGELDTNYEGKAEAAINALRTRDFCLIHVEAPDECTHNGDLAGKLEAIKRLDSRTVAPLLKGMREFGDDFRILILSDHKTLLEDRLHNSDPVPFILYDSRKIGGTGLTYTEANGEKGVAIKAGIELMPLLFELC